MPCKKEMMRGELYYSALSCPRLINDKLGGMYVFETNDTFSPYQLTSFACFDHTATQRFLGQEATGQGGKGHRDSGLQVPTYISPPTNYINYVV